MWNKNILIVSILIAGLLMSYSDSFAEKEKKMNDAISVIHSRKSVRNFTGQEVSMGFTG